jgi:hypothetical protein
VTYSSETVSLGKFGLFESAKPAENLAMHSTFIPNPTKITEGL